MSNYNRLNIAILVLVTFFLHSCGQTSIPPGMIGQWRTNKNLITVRTKSENGKFVFTSDSAIITLRINSDHTVNGSVGSAKFENDPLASKEVELWLAPLQGKIIDAELRYTEGWSHFPMAGIIFNKIED